MAFNWLYLVDPFIAWAIDQIPVQKPVAGKIEAQSANEGVAPPVVFGTRDVEMNIVWDGRSYSRPYKKKGGKK